MVPESQVETPSRTVRFNFLAMVLTMLLFVPLTHGQQLPIQEIPLERCDRLPVVIALADGKSMRLLLDTGATSALNLKGFSKGESQRIQVSSWSGTVETRARKARIRELVIGGHMLRDLSLPAFDLEPISRACGGRIDGILGVDLLEELSATIDLKRFVLRLEDSKSTSRKRDEMLPTKGK